MVKIPAHQTDWGQHQPRTHQIPGRIASSPPLHHLLSSGCIGNIVVEKYTSVRTDVLNKCPIWAMWTSFMVELAELRLLLIGQVLISQY